MRQLLFHIITLQDRSYLRIFKLRIILWVQKHKTQDGSTSLLNEIYLSTDILLILGFFNKISSLKTYF